MEAAWEEALEIAREIGDPRLLALALFDYSFVPRLKEDMDGTATLLREGLVVAMDAGDRILVGSATLFLGYLSASRGDVPPAMKLLQEAVAIGRETGNLVFLGEALGGLASMELLAGTMALAKEHLLEVMDIHIAAGNTMGLASMLLPLSLVVSHEGRHELAARLHGNAARMRDELGGGPPSIAFERFGDPAEGARQALGEAGYQRAWAEGHALTIDEVVAMVLDDVAAPT
jgi:anaphase-promoting complex subunit 5